MKGIRLLIDTRNAAFEDCLNEEVARILRKLSERIDEGVFPEKLIDINGNTVGYVHIEEDDKSKTVTPQVEALA
tara:strand:- start:1156 stop:1377 length:222 start_codon:yes stop_codon:yes gene_type:complete